MISTNEQVVGDYQLLRQLSSGTSGKVKLARHVPTNKIVAIKIINKTRFEQKPEFKRKVYREIALMRLLDHPHLLKLIEVCESSRRLYIVLEYAAHGELFDYLVRKKSCSLEEGIRIFQEIIYGLEYLHGHVICHRDLKPENILLNSHDQVKIADFGFARWMRSNIAETSCGSPHYAAPEVIKGLAYDGRCADIWSCGVILYALLSGRLPFDDSSIRNLMTKVKNGRFQMPPFLPEIQDLISRMLVVDPTKRIRLEQIKEHPAFRICLPPNYVIPTPLPLPYMKEPIDVKSLDPKIFTVLIHLGYSNKEEIIEELSSDTHNMAKVFCYILTSSFSFENLNWSGQNHPLNRLSSEEYLIESNPFDDGQNDGFPAPAHSIVTASSADDTKSTDQNSPNQNSENRPRLTATSTSSLPRRPPESVRLKTYASTKTVMPTLLAGSPDVFGSLIEKTPWPTEVDAQDFFEGTSTIKDIKVPLLQLIAAIQQHLTSHHYIYYYPNDMMIITKHPEDDMYIILATNYEDNNTISLSIHHKNGSLMLISAFIQSIQQIIDSFS